jgi:hypothetical protein
MSTQHPTAQADSASRAASEQRLRAIFTPGSLVWITDEQYDSNGPVWRVTMIGQGEAGRWWRRRYRYDIPSDTLHFGGEEPASDAALLAARTSGRRL